jgi:hypothetical protein
MLKKILIGLGGAIAVFVVVVATRPAQFSVERSLAMAAPPSAPYALVNDFKQWGQWSPWEKMDPTMKKEYSGSATGVGAEYHWVGNDQVGEGKMSLTETKPNESVTIRLAFIKPFAAENTTTFTFAPDGAGTKVTWRMAGENDFVGKAFCMFMDMDAMVGKDFESGLAAMKAAAEGTKAAAEGAKPAAAPVAATASDAGH